MKLQPAATMGSPNGSEMFYVNIDEADMLSVQYQGALKSLMSERTHVLFILTTNYIDKIDRGIRSRCEKVPLDPAPAERWMDRARLILNQEKIIISDETPPTAAWELVTQSEVS